jgi:hypothetical protein
VLALCAVLAGGVFVFASAPVALAGGTCPNEAFRTGPSANLPDCRAYEQVTPVYKAGGIFEGKPGLGPEGEPDLLLESNTAIAGISSDTGYNDYSTVRSGSGWVTSPLVLPGSEYQFVLPSGHIVAGPEGVSLDARSTLWVAHRDGQPENRVGLFVTRPGGTIEEVGPVSPPGTPLEGANSVTQALGFQTAGVSDDLSHVLFTLEEPRESQGYHYWPGDTTDSTGKSLYEYVGTGNVAPLLVGVNEDGSLISKCETELGGGGVLTHNAMSGDGSTIFFTAKNCGSSPPVDELFARLDNGLPNARTVAISEPSPVDCSTCETKASAQVPARFVGASQDGSKVFFTTSQPLLDGAVGTNIYEFDFDAPAGERVVRVSGGDSTVSNPVAGLEGVVQVSEDGSHVYFVASGVLTRTPNSQGQVAHVDANNLYVFERDAQYPAGRIAFIADLSNGDRDSLWEPGPALSPRADLTPDGRFLVFQSVTDHLTSDDTSTAGQVFEYDAQTGALVRVSIGQNGYNDNGNTDIEGSLILAPYYGTNFEPAVYWKALTVSTDGSYVFFEESAALTPQALNYKVIGERNGQIHYANNIYEYHDGSVYLISDGRDISTGLFELSSVALWGVSASGADVFFSTVDQLVPQDDDTDIDVYDARIDGGFPPPVVAPECSGDGCQGPLSAAPTLLSPGSEFQAGTPNVVSSAEASPAGGGKPAVKPKREGKRRKAGKRGKKAGRRRGGKARRAGVGRGNGNERGLRS